jgi:hypothetical protein
MVSLWASKKGEEPEARTIGSSYHGESIDYTQPRFSAAAERTRLLPPPGQAYLSPDDPAVSPCPSRISNTSL